VSRDELLRTSLHLPAGNLIHTDGSPFRDDEQPWLIARTTGKPVRDKVAGLWNPLLGGHVWVIFNALPIFVAEEPVPRWVALTMQDISEGMHARSVILAGSVEERRQALLRELREQERNGRMEKLASLGILVGGVAREISNPAQVITLGADFFANAWSSAEPVLERMAREEGDFSVGGISWEHARAEVPAALANMHAACVRIDAIVRGLICLARQDIDGTWSTFDLNDVVKASLAQTSRLASSFTCEVTSHLAPGLPRVRGSFPRLEQVVVNLLTNACQALRSTEDALCVSTAFDAGTQEVVLLVVDGGRGMSPAQLSQIKDPFFTTRRESGGLGLGVPVAESIVVEYGGSLSFFSEQGRGTTAIVRLPADPREKADA
jgi:two-component system, NtrC family, sensor kinase